MRTQADKLARPNERDSRGLRAGRSPNYAEAERMTSPTSPPSKMRGGVPFTHRLRVRYVECDPQGVVSNVHYLTYFDVAMTEFHREAIGKYSQLIEAGAEMVVADARARYHAPAAFDQELDVEVALAQLGTTSLTVLFAVTHAEALLVEGELRYVFIDPATKTKRPIPEHVRLALAPYLSDPGG